MGFFYSPILHTFEKEAENVAAFITKRQAESSTAGSERSLRKRLTNQVVSRSFYDVHRIFFLKE